MATDLIKGALALLGVLVLQVTVTPMIEIGPAHPDLALVILLWFAERAGPVGGTLAGFGLGILQDMVSIGPVGSQALAKSSLGFWVGRYCEHRETAPTVTFRTVLVLVAGLLQGAFLGLFAVQGGGAEYRDYWVASVVPSAAYTTVIGWIWAISPWSGQRHYGAAAARVRVRRRVPPR